MQWWKWVGLAGVAGVAATGVVIARNERQRRSYTSDDVRARLHARLDGGTPPPMAPGAPPAGGTSTDVPSDRAGAEGP